LLFRPVFLPDPKDGSLYTFGQGIDGLKKLPFTIPELVTASPCRSSDGTLYTGEWFILEVPQLFYFNISINIY